MRRLLAFALTAATCACAATAQAAPRGFEPVDRIELESPEAGSARGTLTLFEAEDGEQAFNVSARGLERSGDRSAIGIWLVGGGRSRLLGFAPPVGGDGRLGTSGPREPDAEQFPKWLRKAHRMLVTVETRAKPERPGETVLRGDLR